MIKLKNIFIKAFGILKMLFSKAVVVLGVFFFVLLILSFTDIPYYAYHHLGTANTIAIKKVDLIVLLGGNGMPSPDGLMRCYATTEMAKQHPDSKIVIALPYDKDETPYQLKLMANELITRGIDSSRISYEPLGFNTHSQAVNIALVYDKKLSVLIITSPEHTYRSIATFRKAGFSSVSGAATFDHPLEEEKILDKENSKDIRIKNLNLRYNMWSYLNYELVVAREYCAIAYYKIKGWM